MNDSRTPPIIGKVSCVSEIRIRCLPPDDIGSPKGANTWNWLFPDGVSAGRTMIARRFAADEVGNHFHSRIPNKDPETFLLIMGTIQYYFKDAYGDIREEILDADALGPIEIEIPPYILHKLTILTQTAWFLEQQRTAFSPKDNYSSAEFGEFSKNFSEKRGNNGG